jgi:PAS domain S-box-containing protein/putative nucleotidyltransferase with HDIG domain
MKDSYRAKGDKVSSNLEQGEPAIAPKERSVPDREGLHPASADPETLWRLILGLSTNFIVLPPDDMDDGINDVLKAIGSFALVDRACVFQFRHNGAQISRTHQWRTQGCVDWKRPAEPVSPKDLPWFCEKIRNYEVVHIPDVAALPSHATAEKKIFLRQGIRSMVAVPIVSADEAIGFIGFESVRATKTWPENIIALLKIVGEIFAFALSRKRATEALRQSESKYRVLFEHANDAIFLIKDDKFVDCNTKTLTMFGCMREQITGHSTIEFSPPQQADGGDSKARIVEMERLALSGKPQFFEWRYRRHDGILFDSEVSFSRMDVGDQVFLQSIVRDITDRKQGEEKLAKSLDNLRRTIGATVQVIAHVVETRDAYTAGHQRRVADLARSIAVEMNLPSQTVEAIRVAGVIHDIGKISVPAEILSKPGELRHKEFELIKDHPQTGYEILKDVEFPWPIAEIVLQHHERADGSGYPRGLKGDGVLLEARIIAVSDVVEAIASHRPYRPSRGLGVALNEIEKYRGSLYDPDVVDACIRLFREKAYRFD